MKAFARAAPTPKRFGLASASDHRCRPAVGGGAARSDSVHNCAIQHGVELTLTSLCAKDDKGRKFVAAQNHHAITCMHHLRRDWCDIVPSQGGSEEWSFAQAGRVGDGVTGFLNAFLLLGDNFRQDWSDSCSSQGRWRLLDDLPDTDGTGISMSEEIFTKRWDSDHWMVVKHLLKNTRGNWLSWMVSGREGMTRSPMMPCSTRSSLARWRTSSCASTCQPLAAKAMLFGIMVYHSYRTS